ncbi:2-keto-3-deoxy-galactonokinase [Runella rosea]|uniref:2-keto-3-deoxy-galactonokinase n=1 Tax=Runella rosea TaxID=2259595 RepID=A0A344TFA0_9BACT|nr:2-dehydro-3-deoxygalactonokinase [Runella rosea]AXE17321.1 2-keto-3-deoxy-galactonokinase [Runella rosea]
MKNYLIGCDWGTTSFRLRLIETVENKVISEVLSSEGVASTFDAWKATKGEFETKKSFFIQRLKEQLVVLAQQSKVELDGIEIVISGMASSSIGMYEVPYATLPYDVDGAQTAVHRLEADAYLPHDILLISGIRSEHDVMRGEETQLVGLAELLHLSENQRYILILPGTHSKHLYVQNNRLIDFQTYMTGEVFSMISHHSILKESVEKASLELSVLEIDAFKMGVRESGARGVLRNLFRVRTNQLFQKWTKKENGLYLSGLLIGSEIHDLLAETEGQLVLCSGNNLYELYKAAVEELGLSDRTLTVSAEMVDRATVVGQVKIFQNQALLLNNQTL